MEPLMSRFSIHPSWWDREGERLHWIYFLIFFWGGLHFRNSSLLFFCLASFLNKQKQLSCHFKGKARQLIILWVLSWAPNTWQHLGRPRFQTCAWTLASNTSPLMLASTPPTFQDLWNNAYSSPDTCLWLDPTLDFWRDMNPGPLSNSTPCPGAMTKLILLSFLSFPDTPLAVLSHSHCSINHFHILWLVFDFYYGWSQGPSWLVLRGSLPLDPRIQPFGIPGFSSVRRYLVL